MGNKPSGLEQEQGRVQQPQHPPTTPAAQQQHQQQQVNSPNNVPEQVDRSRAHSEEKAGPWRSRVEPAQPPQHVSQPMTIGGASGDKPESWDDDDDNVSMPQLQLLSQSAPVFSHRFPRDMPERPALRPIDTQPQFKDVEEILLPPPSLPDRLPFSMGHHHGTSSNVGAISQSVPLSRSLLQSAMSMPQFETKATRARQGSILDMIAAPENAVTDKIAEIILEDTQDDTRHDSDDDDLPFR
eukprot:c7298_g1_i1.p1 GENE.c7298_g1_i1~~c7298_g1_i1.p1  ORF type:complete len:241 (+),score=39.20 c7298_g1_i1:195-917(+)